MNAKLVFEGGTVGENEWRRGFEERLTACGVPRSWLFNPVVPNWTPECQVREDEAKKIANVVLYVIADPKNGTGISAYSLVEATMALYDDPKRAIVVFDKTGLEGHALKVVSKVERDLRDRFPVSYIFSSMEEAEGFLVNTLL